jgi:hypothetical protein
MRIILAIAGSASLLLAVPVRAQTTNDAFRMQGDEVGARVAVYVQSHMGKKVGRGECWDLAAEALNEAGAVWDGSYGWGVVIDPDKEGVQPGDVVQFTDVVLEWDEGNATSRVNMAHHTAVVMEVKGPGVFVIAHQNFGPIGRKVGTMDLVLAHRKKGTISFHRPQG